jgi:hypothetical protein
MPGVGIDPETMARTFDRVTADLDQWGDLWGVDFPMFAMTAARLGRPRDAVDFLLAEHPNNTFRANGCNVMPGGPAYLPGNGGLLWAVAMMAAGWDGGPDHHAPGFPDDDWTVRYEGLRPPQ